MILLLKTAMFCDVEFCHVSLAECFATFHLVLLQAIKCQIFTDFFFRFSNHRRARPRCILTTFSQLRVLGCAMAASNLSRSAEDRNDRAALLAPDLERKAEELKHQLQTTVQSDIWIGLGSDFVGQINIDV
jgi:hypothetical protein